MDALTELTVLGLILSAALLAMACVKADRVRAWRSSINPSAEELPDAAFTAARVILVTAAGIGIYLAIQSFGVVPLDVRKTPASFVACGGLKWLCATPGSGFLWVNPLVAARSRPARFGFWSGQPAMQKSGRDWLKKMKFPGQSRPGQQDRKIEVSGVRR